MACFAVLVVLAPTARSGTSRSGPSSTFVEQALCVHSGWHYISHRPRRGMRPEYVLFGHGFWRTWNVPDSLAGGSGEGGWSTVNGYGGGMQFMVGTWNRAAALSGGLVPFAGAQSSIALQPPRVQILAAWFIVRQDGGSWREWPQTSRACGYR